MNGLSGFNQYVNQAMESWDCPGTAISIVRGEELIHKEAYGSRDVAHNLPMTVDTRFALASCTKSITALSIALLVDDGKLEWDKPVKEYIPEFELNDPYASQYVTIRDMLCHRTGLPRHDFAAWRLDIPRTEFVKRLKHLKFNTTFRQKFQYNNLMYYAAAYLVEQISGQEWETFVQTRLFEPLGMNGSNFHPNPPDVNQMTSKGYRIERNKDGRFKQLIETPYGNHPKLSPGSAGALFSTLDDQSEWLKLHVNQGRSGAQKIISEEGLRPLITPQITLPVDKVSETLRGSSIMNYGMGWFIEPYQGHTLVHHGGNVEGFSLVIGFVPDEQIGIVVLTNIGMIPLQNALFYEALDRTLACPNQDWNRRYHTLYDPSIVAAQKAKATSVQDRKNQAPLSHNPDDYVGTFQAKGYPDFMVRRSGTGYQASIPGSLDWSELRHYHHNVFEWLLTDFDEWEKVNFQINDNGQIDSLSIPMESNVENIIYKRKPIRLNSGICDLLVGDYSPPVEGSTLTILRKGEVMYLTHSGSVPTEIKPISMTDESIVFQMDRSRIEFILRNCEVEKLVMKMPGMTMDMPRSDTPG